MATTVAALLTEDGSDDPARIRCSSVDPWACRARQSGNNCACANSELDTYALRAAAPPSAAAAVAASLRSVSECDLTAAEPDLDRRREDLSLLLLGDESGVDCFDSRNFDLFCCLA